MARSISRAQCSWYASCYAQLCHREILYRKTYPFSYSLIHVFTRIEYLETPWDNSLSGDTFCRTDHGTLLAVTWSHHVWSYAAPVSLCSRDCHLRGADWILRRSYDEKDEPHTRMIPPRTWLWHIRIVRDFFLISHRWAHPRARIIVSFWSTERFSLWDAPRSLAWRWAYENPRSQWISPVYLSRHFSDRMRIHGSIFFIQSSSPHFDSISFLRFHTHLHSLGAENLSERNWKTCEFSWVIYFSHTRTLSSLWKTPQDHRDLEPHPRTHTGCALALSAVLHFYRCSGILFRYHFCFVPDRCCIRE